MPQEPTQGGSRPHQLEAVERELFEHRFVSLAREMGEMLRRMALSTNVKERLDYSCALLDAEGRLVVNAPHIPVHLGALGLCVRAVREVVELEPGDAVVTNHPAYGGSHLPDVTLISPVHAGAELVAFVANRAHHAEIGGTRPGSVPPHARRLVEEGVVIAPRHLLRRSEERWEELAALLMAPPYPSRSPEENLADLRAALAANLRGVERVRALCDEHGVAAVRRHMAGLRTRAAERMSAALVRFGDRECSSRQELDDGSPIQARIVIKSGRATIDLSGSAPVHPGNLNATAAVVTSATLYVLRLLVGAVDPSPDPLPLNEGLLDPVDLRIPAGSMLSPVFPDDPALAPAVVGGNVETSQRLVDTLLAALGLAACSQGTMNNVIFGNERFGYYETVCGGAGATPRAPGADAVHTHMTNTRITDPELLEQRYPVRLRRFEVRRGSGGAGRHRGGDGVIRELEALAPLQLSLLGQHRKVAPCGAAGGEPGARGAQRLVREGGGVEEVEGVCVADLEPGDRLILETPGGGGWGRAGS
jgi:5-oxoprolinase (ATP-hydrolysing)